MIAIPVFCGLIFAAVCSALCFFTAAVSVGLGLAAVVFIGIILITSDFCASSFCFREF